MRISGNKLQLTLKSLVCWKNSKWLPPVGLSCVTPGWELLTDSEAQQPPHQRAPSCTALSTPFTHGRDHLTRSTLRCQQGFFFLIVTVLRKMSWVHESVLSFHSLTTDYIKRCFPTKQFVIISRIQTTPLWVFMNYSRKSEGIQVAKI